ncbi:hypothetical protein AGMMS50276_11920 [Synergistales bacterium]|nr:hypothetical protein AGMMS50276_11920 [Synergistales bacterium]
MKARLLFSRRGFSLVEVLCAIVILTVAVLASLATIGYALAITTDNKIRMETYAKLERFALESEARNEVVSPEWVDGSTLTDGASPVPPNSTSSAKVRQVNNISVSGPIPSSAITLWRVPYSDNNSNRSGANKIHRLYMRSPTVVVILP